MIALDADEAGRQAAERAVERAFLDAQERDMDLRVLTLPPGQDPADFATAHGGDAFRKAMSESEPVVRFRLATRLAGIDLSEPEAGERAFRGCLSVLAQVRDESTRTHYTRWAAERANIDFNAAFLLVGQALKGSAAVPSPAGVKRVSAQVRLEREALKVALQYPEAADPYLDLVEPGDFSVKAHRELWTLLRQPDADPTRIAATGGDVTRFALEPIEGHDSPDDAPPDRLVAEIFTRLQEFALTRQINEVKARLEKKNPIEEPDAYDALFKELIGLEGARRRHRIIDLEGA